MLKIKKPLFITLWILFSYWTLCAIHCHKFFVDIKKKLKNWLNKDNSTLELTICTLPLLFAVIKSTPLNYDEKYEQKYDSRSRGTEFKVVQPKVKKVINLKDGKWFLLCMQSTFQEMLLAGMVGYGTAFVVVLLPNTLKYVYTVNKIVNTTMSAIIVDDKKKSGQFNPGICDIHS
jgi:hypothetical protein